MSGRDLRNFVTTHRAEEADRLVKRLTDGLGSHKYKPVNYDHLRAVAADKKFSGQESLIKVKKLEEVSRQGREHNLLKQHRRVWHAEFNKLNTHRKKTQAEIEYHCRQAVYSDECEQIFTDLDGYEGKLSAEFDKFKKNTVDPIWALREDLKYWLLQNKPGLQSHDPEVCVDHKEVMVTVDSVRIQQQQVLDRLQNEQMALEGELNAGELPELIAGPDKRIVTGIPQEAFELECPPVQDDLKASILQEFILLDEKYLDRLNTLEFYHGDAIRSSSGGWSEQDHYIFTVIKEQYPRDLSNHRTLYIDRLRRHLPHKQRQHIVAHEEWAMQYEYYHKRRKALLTDWTRDRRELLNRATVVMSEVTAAYELHTAQVEQQKQQKEICDALYEKVREWRAQKEELLRMEAELEENARQEELRRIREEEERNKAKRAKQREQIHAFQDKQSLIRKAAEEEARKRIESLQEEMAEQAKHDRERLEFRMQQQEMKEKEKLQKRQERELAEIEKEERLEALREQVRPNVEADLLRVWADTAAWKAHMKGEEDINIQRPLFEVNSFASNKVTSDPRVRLEHKLREAGVLNTDYARQIMSTVKPLQAPRRDMESTVFKMQ